ncbi:MAG: glycogen debranching protein GlgX [Candidatus Caenarcaniphilales bacterium]|nr:glycogen debranching protein GlgX [Candidatus Caenarcaniphilales bacterium]
MKKYRVLPGQPYPLGATWDGLGVNFALFSENAHKVELCLFDSQYSSKEACRIEMPEYNDHVWHCYLPEVRPGQVYGYRVYGDYDPATGHRFNPNKILVDPYAKAIVRTVKWDNSLYGYDLGSPDKDLSFSNADNAAFVPLCAVVDDAFTWGDDRAPKTPWHKTIIYEAHVKGLTFKNTQIPDNLRGTYSALATEPAIKYLKDLGVTAIELLPVHHRVDNKFLVEKNLKNYWGYNTLGFFAPDIRFSSSAGPIDHVREFKMMVRSLHAAGIEVILDVVYNHTAEGSELGPTLSFRGIDNCAYYRLMPDSSRYYKDFTGCGNTLNMVHPRVLQLIMDSLRYWITEMHVDGFRFDLASALARELHEVDRLGAFFDIIHQDPVISQVKLIAEPWDLGEGGYQVGNFPILWTEWNGKYRDNLRCFWKSDDGQVNQFASRITGSSDLYEASGRKPHASINFITCHDGFTLQDLVSYNQKHNLINGEDNRDGENHNNSWNCGVEGETSDVQVLALREKQKKNLVASLLLSLGVPMILSGDEICRTQKGNNNAYCQDNELNWHKWDLNEKEKEFLDFIKKLIKIRKKYPVLLRRKFFRDQANKTFEKKDILWLNSQGKEMKKADWLNPKLKTLGAFFNGNSIEEHDEQGYPILSDSLLMLFNAHHENVTFTLPKISTSSKWRLLLSTSTNDIANFDYETKGFVELEGRSLIVFSLKS